jgi:hypothetical protein
MAQATATTLKWQAVGTCAYAVARSGGSLLVFMRGDHGFTVRFGDAGRPVDFVGQSLAFTEGDAGGIHFDAGSGAWHEADQGKLTIDGTTAQVIRLDPPAERSPALPLAVHADIEAAGAPWWLSASWQGLAAPGEPSAPAPAKEPKKPKK